MKGRDQHDDWAALGNDWRAQAVDAVDVEALRNEVRQRGRRLRWALINELVGFVAAMGLCVWVLVSRQPGPTSVVIIGLMAILLGFQGWSLWIRRRQVSDSGLGTMAMVDLEIARALTSLLYWRVSIWLSMAMCLALYALTMSGVWAPVAPTDDLRVREIIPALGGVASLCIGCAVWAWWLGRRTQARLLHLRRLRAELRDN